MPVRKMDRDRSHTLEDDLTKASFQFSVETASVVVDHKKAEAVEQKACEPPKEP